MVWRVGPPPLPSPASGEGDVGARGRWRAYDYDQLIARDKASLDIFWLKDESLEDSDNLPAPEVSGGQRRPVAARFLRSKHSQGYGDHTQI